MTPADETAAKNPPPRTPQRYRVCMASPLSLAVPLNAYERANVQSVRSIEQQKGC